MATNLAIDPALLERALAVSGERSKKAVSGSSSLGASSAVSSNCSGSSIGVQLPIQAGRER